MKKYIIYLAIMVVSILLIQCNSTKSIERKIKTMNYKEVMEYFEMSTNGENLPDRFPMYPDGVDGIINDISRYMTYPKSAIENGIEGKEIIKYTINKDGKIENISIVKSLSADIDKECIRVIKLLKSWIPGQKGGTPINVEFKQPITFNLPK